MSGSEWVQLIGMAITVVGSVSVGFIGVVKYMGRSMIDKAVADSQLASSIDKLSASISEMSNGIKHMDDRLDQHDIDIAILKDRQKNQ